MLLIEILSKKKEKKKSTASLYFISSLLDMTTYIVWSKAPTSSKPDDPCHRETKE